MIITMLYLILIKLDFLTENHGKIWSDDVISQILLRILGNKIERCHECHSHLRWFDMHITAIT